MRENIKVVIISFTEEGSKLNAGLNRWFAGSQMVCESYAVERFARQYSLSYLPKDMKKWIGDCWGQAAFVFIGAVGIAVRYIAPWVQDKYTDSPVIVIDEKGGFVIPILSGHVGGAVEIADKISKWIGAVPVITTATDIQGKFAVDVFAKRNGLHIHDRKIAKEISAAVLENRFIGFYSSLPVQEMPAGIKQCHSRMELAEYQYGIAITEEEEMSGDYERNILSFVAKPEIVVGIGCRRGTTKDELEAGLTKVMEANHIKKEQITCIVSIDLKKDEKGILELAEDYGIPFKTFTATKLKTIEKVSSCSPFVEQTTGVDNVCERAAKFFCPEGEVLQPKICVNGSTYAFVKKRKTIMF